MSTQRILSRGDVKRARRRLSDLEAWLTSANGDHRPNVDFAAALDIVRLRDMLATVNN